jgi:hypothetical protein
MRDTLRAAVFAAAALLPVCARADFVVSGQAGAHAKVTAAPQATQPDQKADHAVSTDAETSHDPIRPRLMIAQGFGDDVPLRFAVRQIVPKSVRVVYGPGTSPDALVSWKGGQGWNWVLFHAVRPLGLRLVMRPMAVEIRK